MGWKMMPNAKIQVALADVVNTSKYSREGKECTWHVARARNRKGRQKKERKN